jgi:superfamily II DNA or RNA helicase
MTTQALERDSFVRVRGQPSRVGRLLELQDRRGRTFGRVQFAAGVSDIPADQLELVPVQVESSVDHLRRGHLESPEILRRHLAHVRLSGRMSDMLYSLEATDTQFFAHQFKPVLKLLDSPTGHLLIADEVGLGKTIEAGLIWTELAARHRYGRLVVICPKALCDKWRMELSTKFDIDARIIGPADLQDSLSNTVQQRRGFAAICSLPSVRPRVRPERESRPVDRLADMVENIDAFDMRIDLLIIDEAHHLRNPGTQSNSAGRLFSAIARHVVMLSATPINLRSEDLQSLLRLVDPDTFRDPRALDGIIEANAPLIAARDAILSGAPNEQVRGALDVAAKHALLKSSQQLAHLRREIAAFEGNMTGDRRAKLAAHIESINLLANVVNRTRRRDVEEHRVVRDAKAWKANMVPMEREVYVRATRTILDYAEARRYPAGFLTVMPQRLLASCMPAALAHWRGNSETFGIEDGLEDDDRDDTPLKNELGRMVKTLPTPAELEAVDTKFTAFVAALKGHQADHPSEKVVVFSTFLGTLDYLRRRLAAEGIGVTVLDSRTEGRTEVIGRFKADPAIQVLLSSEVGSEGIDLQFATVVINYDLPWNPMRVEQRIGRIDRLGQTAPKVTILNLMHRNTVDERIWDRLYDRLKLCERALGGFEEVLGTEINALEKDLLSGRLTEGEQQGRIDQTAQAIENVREHEERLEGDAAALIAHGDYVLREIREKRSGQRWISPEDIVDYLHLGLGRLHPKSRVTWDRASEKLEVRLDPEARHAFGEWGRSTQVDPGPLARSASPLTFRLGSPDPTSRIPRMSQAHALLRYLTDKLGESGAMSPCAVAARISSASCGLPAGHYAGAVQEWKFGQRDPELRLAVLLFDVETGRRLDLSTSEAVLRRALDIGRPWTEATEVADVETLAQATTNVALDELAAALEAEAEHRRMKAEDRLAMQLATLDRGATEDRQRLERVIREAGPRLEAANRRRLELLDERVAQRRLELTSSANAVHESRDVAVVLLRVEDRNA